MSTIVTSSSVSGSSNIYVTGTNSDVDSSALIEAAVAAKLAKADTLETQIDTLEAEQAAYQEMDSLLTTLSETLDDLSGSSDDGAFSQNSVYLSSATLSTPTNYLSATVTDEAETGTYSIVVEQVATSHKIASSEQASDTALGLSGSFTIGTSDGSAVEITLDAEMTIEDIAYAINLQTDTSGVKASLVRTSDGAYTLTLAATDTGVEIELAASSGDDVLQSLGLTDADGAIANELQAAQEAIVTVDGLTVTSTTNEIEDVIPGVSLDLYNATAGATITLEVEQDLSSLQTVIESFVDAYNAYRDFALSQQEVDSDGGAADGATLFGEVLLRQANRAIYEALLTSVEVDGTSYTLADIGITYGDDNMLQIDEETLENALLYNADVVQALFSASSTTSTSDLGVVGLPGSLDSGSYEISIVRDPDSGTITSASIDGVALNVSGSTLSGESGTAYEGLWLVYTGEEDATVTLTVSQGLADTLIATLDNYINDTDGLLLGRSESLGAAISDKEDQITRIEQQAADLEEYLISYYAKLEAKIEAANITLAQLEALLNSDD